MLGAQRPRFVSVPPRVSTAGPEAVDLAARAGLVLDPWQAFVLDGALSERSGGQWSSFETAMVVSRQSGKGSILEARELAGLFLFGEELILHSAHEFKTSQEAFLRIRWLIDNADEFRKRVKRIRTSHGDEGVELLPSKTTVTGPSGRHVSVGKAPRLRFVARTSGSGRGFSGDVVILDEAFNLPTQVISALMPTMSARPNPQLWYASSAVNQEEHPHGEVLTSIRLRGLKGDDPSLAYFEWSADEDAYKADPVATAADPQQWAAANPGLGIRISAEHVGREHRSMPAKSFMVERLGIGDWPDLTPGGTAVIDQNRWNALMDPESQVEGSVVFAVDATPERSAGAIAAAGLRADGLLHAEVIADRPGTGWLLQRLIELHATWAPRAIVLDPSSAVGSLIPGLQEAGIEPVLVSGREMAQACGAFYDLVVESGGMRHLGQLQLATALAGARKRDLGDAWAWHRKDSSVNISPLVAVTLALHGCGKPVEDEQPVFFAWR